MEAQTEPSHPLENSVITLFSYSSLNMIKSFSDEFLSEMNFMAVNGEPFFFIIDYKLEKVILIPTEECKSNGIFFEIEGYTNFPGTHSKKAFQIVKHPVTYQEYLKAFCSIKEQIHIGNTYLANLTFSTPIEINASFEEIFLASTAKYKLIYKDQFLVFSPESFVKISNGKISTFPMKGTIDADIENAEQLLLSNEKETAEHSTIVDLLRNDLSRVSTNVQVEKFKYIEKINTSGKNLLQMSSVISGDLPGDYKSRLANILLELLPAGSICGAPKKATLDIIEKAEQHQRGFYTGVFGVYDGVNVNSGVMIRYIENQNGQLVYKSGGGITAMSDPIEEYQELIDKIYVPLN